MQAAADRLTPCVQHAAIPFKSFVRASRRQCFSAGIKRFSHQDARSETLCLPHEQMHSAVGAFAHALRSKVRNLWLAESGQHALQHEDG